MRYQDYVRSAATMTMSTPVFGNQEMRSLLSLDFGQSKNEVTWEWIIVGSPGATTLQPVITRTGICKLSDDQIKLLYQPESLSLVLRNLMPSITNRLGQTMSEHLHNQDPILSSFPTIITLGLRHTYSVTHITSDQVIISLVTRRLGSLSMILKWLLFLPSTGIKWLRSFGTTGG